MIWLLNAIFVLFVSPLLFVYLFSRRNFSMLMIAVVIFVAILFFWGVGGFNAVDECFDGSMSSPIAIHIKLID